MTRLVWWVELGHMVCLSDAGCPSLAASETYGCAGHYKQTVQGPSIDTHHTLALSTVSRAS